MMITPSGGYAKKREKMISRTLVIGDIHGCRREFLELLDRVDADPFNDRLIFLGDYVDRGPDSRGVIEEILELQRQSAQVIALKGNHEEMLLSYLAGRDRDFYLSVGGRQTLLSYGCTEPFNYDCALNIPDSHQQFLYNLLPYWEDEKYIFVHAGLSPGIHLTQQSPDWLYWAAGGNFAAQRYDFGKRVIFGHSVVSTPVVKPEKIGLDTGCVYGGNLSCLVLPDLEFVQVRCRKYWPPGK